MSISLVSADDQNLSVNAWNWGVLHYLVRSSGIFPEEFWEPIRFSAGDPLDADQVVQLADFLEHRVLKRLQPDQRMFFDGSVTDEPDDGTFYREEGEMWRNYSLHYDVLMKVIEFCRQARPPIEVG